MKLRNKFAALILSSSFLAASGAHAVLIDFNTVIPDENILLNFNDSGLDWVYAGPIAPGEFGPGNIETPDYRAAEGWRYATLSEWSARPDWTDFIIGDAIVGPNAGHSDHSTYRFASEYWSNFSHVDLNDANAGRLTNGLDIGSLTDVYETWFVRGSLDDNGNEVPVPLTAYLFGLGLLSLGLSRKRK